MKVHTQPCPSERELHAFVDGTAPAGDRQRIRRHVTSCAICQCVVAGLDVTQKGSADPEDAAWSLTETDPTAPFRSVLGVLDPEDAEVDAATEELNLGMLRPSSYPGSRGRLAQYEVVGVLGRGGMGLVLKGFDTELQRIVAIKVLAPWLAASSRARKRFAREARAAAAINDPHVVTIHAVGDTGDMPYLVMEWIPGQTLLERIRLGPKLSDLEVLRITHQVAAGLQAAHRQAVIHRDIKPGNIMLVDSQARVKITDFGVAIAAEGMGDATSAERMVGTPEYMSPEQIRGEAVDFRSDLFSMGCVVLAMVTGSSPFRGGNPMDTIRRVVDQPAPSLIELEPSVPAGLSELVDRLLRKDPNERPASAQEVINAVETLMARQPRAMDSVEQAPLETQPRGLMGNAVGRPGRWARRRPALIALVLLAGSLGAAVWATRPRQRSGIVPPAPGVAEQGRTQAAPSSQPEVSTPPS